MRLPRPSQAILGGNGFGIVAQFVASRPVLVLLLVLATASLSLVYAVKTLTVEPDVAALLPPDTPFLKDYERYKALFPYDRRTNIVVIDAPAADQAARAQATLATSLREKHGALFNRIRAPGFDDFLATHGLLYTDLHELESFVEATARARPALARLTDDPTLGGLSSLIEDALRPEALEAGSGPEVARLMKFIATGARDLADAKPDAVSWSTLFLGEERTPKRRVLLAQGRLDGPEETVGVDTGTLIRTEAAALGLTPENGFQIRLTGRGPLSAEETNAAIDDVQLAGTISFAMLAIILWVGFRSFRVIVATLFTVVVGLAWTMGFAALSVGQLNLLSIVFAVLFIGLGVDFAIHSALRFLESDASQAASDAITSSFSAGAPALALCAVTSAIGFLSFLPTDYRGLAELGIISAGGMVLAFLASLTVLPALLLLLRANTAGSRPIPLSVPIARLVETTTKGKLFSIAVLLVGTALAITGSQVGFNFNTLALKDQRSDAISAFRDLQADGVSTAYSLSITFPDQAAAEAARAALEQLPTVAGVRGFTDLIPDNQDEKLALIDELAVQAWPAIKNNRPKGPIDGKQALRNLEDLRQTAENAMAQSDVLGKVGADLAANLKPLNSEEAAVELDRRLTQGIYFTVSQLAKALEATKISRESIPPEERSRYISPSGPARLKVLPTADLTDYRSLRRFVEDVENLHGNATGRPKLEYATGKIVVSAFLTAIGLALFAIMAILFVTLRNLRDVVLVMVPLCLAGATTLSYSVLIGKPFNMASVIVIPLILGLGVDNGIHFVMRWRETMDIKQVLHSATTRAIAMSGLTTVASFGTLMIAGNGAIASMGEMLTVGIVSLLIALLLVLPTITSQLHHKK